MADFFMGTGTTGAVAEKLGRKWIGSDLGKFSIHTTRKRMIKIQVSASAHQLFPMEIIEGYFLTPDKQIINIPLMFPFDNGWGDFSSNYIRLNEDYLMPSELHLKWYSIIENKTVGKKSSFKCSQMLSFTGKK